jgi:CheY-like chemotaxis protein
MLEHEQSYHPGQACLDGLEPDLLRHKKKKIMVIDDDQDFRLTICELLVEEGFQVTTAKDGEAALNHLIHLTDLPDLILVDLMMPLKNGLQFRREQEALDRVSDIPVLFITGHGIVEGELSLQKPIDSREFLQTIKDVLGET